MRQTSLTLLRIATCLLGFGALATIPFDIFHIVSAFALWKVAYYLLELAIGLMFLFFTFFGVYPPRVTGLGGGGGAPLAPVVHPPSDRPPALSAAAEQPLDRESPEDQTPNVPNPALQPTPTRDDAGGRG